MVLVIATAAGSAPLSTNPITTILDKLSTDWRENSPAASAITFARRFADLSKDYGIFVKHLITTSPPAVLGSSRYRFTARYKVHVLAKGPVLQDIFDRKFAMEQEIRRIVKTDRRALFNDGFEEWHIDDDFQEIETGNESRANTGIAADISLVLRSVATITLIWDGVVVED